MTQYRKHVFVCTYGPYCWYDGDVDAIFDGLKRSISKAGLKDEIRINRAGCLNQCGNGPMLVVYPDGIWYRGVQPDDVPEIVEQQLLGDIPVDRLRFDRPPGNHKRTEGYPDGVHRMKQVEKRLDDERKAARQALRDELQARDSAEAGATPSFGSDRAED